MGIKDLFKSSGKGRVYTDYETEKEAFESVESMENAVQINESLNTYVPSIDYSKPSRFAHFGSAKLYYQGALDKIINYFPYDGSDAEQNAFFNSLLEIEKYVLNDLYPKYNGYANFSAGTAGWGTQAAATPGGVWGLSSNPEYITFKGGPGTGSAGASIVSQSPNPQSSKSNYSNIYDTNIYQTEGLPDDYGKGTRTSNLRCNFDDGVTVEYWLKTGSFDHASLTQNQCIVDLWNNAATGSSEYGRLMLFLSEDVSNPFRLVYGSGSSEYFNNDISTNFSNATLGSWNHYALTMQNSGSDLYIRLYVNGELNTEKVTTNVVGELNSKNMMGRIGALMTGSTTFPNVGTEGYGKLSGSLDEFRFWKVARNQKQIRDNYFAQVGGGANSDISNADLGVYYKFNEGISDVVSVDNVVLDYAGRICNGAWNGYVSGSRSTNSAIVEAGAAPKENKDPLVRKNNPAYTTLESSLLSKGEFHDLNNNSAFVNYAPAWVIEEHEESQQSNNLQLISHIMGAYFDKLYNLIGDVSKLKHMNYPSSSDKPLPFAMHLPMSMGLYSPDLFVDATLLEMLKNRTTTELFEGKVADAKNLIYQNLYNNVTNIYKSKGTEKSIRNILRCFNIDDSLVRFKTYSRNNVYELQSNLRQITQKNSRLNLNTPANYEGVVYQRYDAADPNTSGYLSGTLGSSIVGREDPYGLTAEAEIIFPKYFNQRDSIDRNFVSSSLFGSYTVNASSAASRNGTDTTWVTPGTDYANFQVYAVRDEAYSKNVRFVLQAGLAPYQIPILSSETFFDVYDDSRWNISVRIKPIVPGLTGLMPTPEEYEVIFRGVNTVAGTIKDQFSITQGISTLEAQNWIRSPKRMYCGATRINVTGAIYQKSDVYISNIKYWAKYLDNASLDLHVQDVKNAGIDKSYQNISGLDTNNGNADLLNINTLALEWNFENVTGSNGSGNFSVLDYSSGSSLIRDNYSWLGNIVGYQHSGYGDGFSANSTSVVSTDIENSFKFTDPEETVASDMVQILSEDDKLFKIVETVPNYVFTIEKSMYQAISEEMMTFFAGVLDFNNLIGDPVNRYRDRYKNIEKLREIYFRRVTNVSTVEKFIAYYKWFDDALSTILAQIMPASADFIPDVLNMVESHTLERNKYASKFPTLETNTQLPNAGAAGVGERLYPGFLGQSPVPQSPRDTTKHIPFWKKRALRNAPEITSGDSTVDTQREKFRTVINSTPHLSQSLAVVSTLGGVQYKSDTYFSRNQELQKLTVDSPITVSPRQARTLKGGVNFAPSKNIDFAYTALRPAGPINTDDGKFVPLNVMISFQDDFVTLPTNNDPKEDPTKKTHVVSKVQHGRDWQSGGSYSNAKSTHSFPFNMVSSTLATGYQKEVQDESNLNINIVNLHNDVYGPDMEKPIQGPFTDAVVGGHQSRHVALNTGNDSWQNRPEAWYVFMGQFDTVSGAVGMAGPDYPWPEANTYGSPPYPATLGEKAWLYRGMVAKSPVNIRNIKRSGSVVMGNYQNNYETISTFGKFSNPSYIRHLDAPLPLPPGAFIHTATSSMVINTLLDVRSRQEGRMFNPNGGFNTHFQFMPDYDRQYLDPGPDEDSKVVIATHFNAPGGMDTTQAGMKDWRASEYSAYNALPWRNLMVKRPSQGPSGTIGASEGMRIWDIAGKDYGLQSHLARHTAKFGRDSLWVPEDQCGASYDQLPGFHKVHRNSLYRFVEGEPTAYVPAVPGATSSVPFDPACPDAHIPAPGPCPGPYPGLILNVTGAVAPDQDFQIHVSEGWNNPGVTDTYTYKFKSHPISNPPDDHTIHIRHTSSLSEQTEYIKDAISGTADNTIAYYYDNNIANRARELSASLGSLVGPAQHFIIHATREDYILDCAGYFSSSFNTLTEDAFTGSQQYFNCGKRPIPAIPVPAFDYLPTYDNFFVQHQIPRSTRQYAWITASVANFNEAWTPPFTPPSFLVKTGSTLMDAYDFVSSSQMLCGEESLGSGTIAGLAAVAIPSYAPTGPGLVVTGAANNDNMTLTVPAGWQGNPSDEVYNYVWQHTGSATWPTTPNSIHLVADFSAYFPAAQQAGQATEALFGLASVTNFNIRQYPEPMGAALPYVPGVKGIRVSASVLSGDQFTMTMPPNWQSDGAPGITYTMTVTGSLIPSPVVETDLYIMSGATTQLTAQNIQKAIDGTAGAGQASYFGGDVNNRPKNFSVFNPVNEGDGYSIQFVGFKQKMALGNSVILHNLTVIGSSGLGPALMNAFSGGVDGNIRSNRALHLTTSVGGGGFVPVDHPHGITLIAEDRGTRELNNLGCSIQFIGNAESWTPSAYTGTIQYLTGCAGSVAPRYYGMTEGSNAANAVYVDSVGLNTALVEPIDSETNTLGSTTTSEYLNPYFSPDYLPRVDATATSPGEAGLLNGLIYNRGNANGWGSWQSLRQSDHKILRKERADNILSIKNGDCTITRYNNPPVTMDGRPVWVNLDYNSPLLTNVTLELPYGEKQYFNTNDLNDRFNITQFGYTTPFEQLMQVVRGPSYKLNWVIYRECVFPADRNEFLTYSRERTGYDNKYWRSSRTEVYDTRTYPNRQELGNSFNTAFNYSNVCKSSWPLDAPVDFLIRTQPERWLDIIPNDSVAAPADRWSGEDQGNLPLTGCAGQLQNTYATYIWSRSMFGAISTSPGEADYLDSGGVVTFGRILGQYAGDWQAKGKLAGPLYARKNTLYSPISSVSPTGISNPYAHKKTSTGAWLTGSPGGLNTQYNIIDPLKYNNTGSYLYLKSDKLAGEAEWEADELAGYVIKSSSSDVFVSAPSEPWFDDYEDFKFELLKLYKDYAIVPEFRISEHVEEYTNLGLRNPAQQDTFEIPGTSIDSGDQSFYKDYSNSDFLKGFLDVRANTLLGASEIRLVCNAAIRFNPYKGFYPVQRTVDLVEKFKDSYKECYEAYPTQFDPYYGQTGPYSPTRLTGSTMTGQELFDTYPGATAPLNNAMFSPGILYNTIKSGLAVDYPVVSDVRKIVRGYPGISSRKKWGKNQDFTYETDVSTNIYNTMVYCSTNADPLGGISKPSRNPWYMDKAKAIESTIYQDFFDKRIPFEAIIDPVQYLTDVSMINLESEPLIVGTGVKSRPTSSLNSIMMLNTFRNNQPGEIYSLMARNFFGAVADFFLEDDSYTSLESDPFVDTKLFESGSVYMARVKLWRSYSGTLDYSGELYSTKPYVSESPWSKAGARALAPTSVSVTDKTLSGLTYLSGTEYFPVPQYPQSSSYDASGFKTSFQENFTLYSRTDGFGPPLAGTYFPPTGGTWTMNEWTRHWLTSSYSYAGMGYFEDYHSLNNGSTATTYGSYAVSPWDNANGVTLDNYEDVTPLPVKDSLMGYNWAYTPPYYDGEAWVDLVFRPVENKAYDLPSILSEIKTQEWRIDPGYINGDLADNPFQSTEFVWNVTGSWYNEGSIDSTPPVNPTFAYPAGPYIGRMIQSSSMQALASLNLFGIKQVPFIQEDNLGNRSQRNQSVAQKWVIKTKFETPHMNFSDVGIRPLQKTGSNKNIATPVFGESVTPQGMWHQFGVVEPDESKGIFLEIGDVDRMWLKNHYEVVHLPSVYNNYSDSWFSNRNLYQNVKSLSSLFGFDKKAKSRKRLGQLKESLTIKEAVVAVPYIVTQEKPLGSRLDTYFEGKKFIEIPKARFEAAQAALKNTNVGESLDAAGISVREQIQKMGNYIMPPQFDFVDNKKIKPVAMYIFEFEYELDKDDLSYIWQNLAPRDFKRIYEQSDSVAHNLIPTELLSETNLLDNENLRWMVFKVKQKSQADYYDSVLQQKNDASTAPYLQSEKTYKEKYIQYNWPYDYLSFVEMIKMDVELKFSKPLMGTLTDAPAGPLVDPTVVGSTSVIQPGGLENLPLSTQPSLNTSTPMNLNTSQNLQTNQGVIGNPKQSNSSSGIHTYTTTQSAGTQTPGQKQREIIKRKRKIKSVQSSNQSSAKPKIKKNKRGDKY